jgi:hypothetical protein
MATFIELDAEQTGNDHGRPVRVNVDQVAYYKASGTAYDPDHATAVYFVGGLQGQAERLVVRQTVAQVAAAIEAASA